MADRHGVRNVLHVVDADLARGAQRSAQLLREQLDQSHDRVEHRLVSIFDAPQAVLRPDLSLDITDGAGRSFGLAPKAASALARNETVKDADLLVAHGGEALKYLAASRLDVPVVYHKIGTLSRRFRNPLRAQLHRWAVHRAVHTIAISRDSAAEAIETLGLSADRVSIIPNGRDPRTFAPAARERSRPRLGFVGHLSRTKRPMWFLDAVRHLRSRGVEVDAYIAGDGPMLSDVAAAARPLDVDVLGSVDDVATLLAETDVFVFTSEREGEGMPGVLLEAAMSGCAIVTTAVPGAHDIVEHGRSGLVVSPDDKAGLVNALQQVCLDAAARSVLGNMALLRARHEFSIDTITAAWRSVLDEVLEVACASST